MPPKPDTPIVFLSLLLVLNISNMSFNLDRPIPVPSSMSLIYSLVTFNSTDIAWASIEFAINSVQHLLGVNPFRSKLNTSPCSFQEPPFSSKTEEDLFIIFSISDDTK